MKQNGVCLGATNSIGVQVFKSINERGLYMAVVDVERTESALLIKEIINCADRRAYQSGYIYKMHDIIDEKCKQAIKSYIRKCMWLAYDNDDERRADIVRLSLLDRAEKMVDLKLEAGECRKLMIILADAYSNTYKGENSYTWLL